MLPFFVSWSSNPRFKTQLQSTISRQRVQLIESCNQYVAPKKWTAHSARECFRHGIVSIVLFPSVTLLKGFPVSYSSWIPPWIFHPKKPRELTRRRVRSLPLASVCLPARTCSRLSTALLVTKYLRPAFLLLQLFSILVRLLPEPCFRRELMMARCARTCAASSCPRSAFSPRTYWCRLVDLSLYLCKMKWNGCSTMSSKSSVNSNYKPISK